MEPRSQRIKSQRIKVLLLLHSPLWILLPPPPEITQLSWAIVWRTFLLEVWLNSDFLWRKFRSLEVITSVVLTLRTGGGHAPSQSISQHLSHNVIHTVWWGKENLLGTTTCCCFRNPCVSTEKGKGKVQKGIWFSLWKYKTHTCPQSLTAGWPAYIYRQLWIIAQTWVMVLYLENKWFLVFISTGYIHDGNGIFNLLFKRKKERKDNILRSELTSGFGFLTFMPYLYTPFQPSPAATA